jgi:hypothetical protein
LIYSSIFYIKLVDYFRNINHFNKIITGDFILIKFYIYININIKPFSQKIKSIRNKNITKKLPTLIENREIFSSINASINFSYSKEWKRYI